MKNAEEAIGKVLAGLRDSETSPGLERRILAAIEERAPQPSAATPRWAWSVAMAGIIAVSLFFAIMTMHRHEHPSTQTRQHVLPAELAESTQEASLLPHEPIAPAVTPVGIAVHLRKTLPISAGEAMLLREMRAPSHPAPVAPLTTEEKLLLRAVHTDDPQVMAMLNPEIRAQQEAVSNAEFQKFVDQSGKDVQESNQTTE